ncbi:MAG: DUF4383 domain-containing protein [Actinomycetota bacterium]|nr:DUF4383 domain-containing protein [Actinomycetota bacterium]
MATTVAVATWSPARIYLVVSGVFLVVASAVGFGIDSSFPASAAEVDSAGSGHIFGIFETNGWHNLSALISGAIALGFAVRPEWARAGALLKGTMYVAVTTSIAIWGPETFKVASNGADQVVHASLALTGLAAGLATPRRPRTTMHAATRHEA